VFTIHARPHTLEQPFFFFVDGLSQSFLIFLYIIYIISYRLRSRIPYRHAHGWHTASIPVWKREGAGGCPVHIEILFFKKHWCLLNSPSLPPGSSASVRAPMEVYGLLRYILRRGIL
jgi:hypothetical protein